jgi:alpha-tubulin suppressor-like RCC1 family protein
LSEYLSDKYIIDICCGFSHSFVLTNSGEVYASGLNKRGQIGNGSSHYECQTIPIKLNGFNDEKLIQIWLNALNGYLHWMALTKRGRVFSWGYNECGQLDRNNTNYSVNKPLIVSLSNENSTEKVCCGLYHTLLLSSDGHIYWFGNNGFEKQITPKNWIINRTKFIHIIFILWYYIHRYYDISIALSVSGINYICGKCGEKKRLTFQKKQNSNYLLMFSIIILE